MTVVYSKTLTTLFGSLLLSFSALLHAGSPVWTFIPLTATSISVPRNSTATVQYLVTNQSAKSRSLVMTPITGIMQTTTGAGICSNPFTLPSKGSSCTLSLQVNGNQLTHSITDGPIVCEQSSTLQCYKPSPSNVLNINVGINEYTIGGTVSGLSGSVVLQNNGTNNETVSSDGAFTFSTAITEGSPYAVTVFTQPTGQTCTVTNGVGTVDGANITNVAVACVANDTTLSASVSTLGLSVNNTGLNAALTGNPRLITITNIGTSTATNVTYSPSPALPSGTTISPVSCGTVAVSDTCALTITPGSTPSAPPGDTNPTPITLSISGTNTNTLTPTLNILTYGSVYQGGYIYAVDDTTPNTGSISGRVIQQSNSSDSIHWDSSTGCTTAPYNSCYETDADSEINGTNVVGGNTYLIYQTLTTTNAEPANSYAAGLCTETINGFDDWYLPAICEMGYGANAAGVDCGTSGLPTVSQNIQATIIENGNPAGLNTGPAYWSSTEYRDAPTQLAWAQSFSTTFQQQAQGTKGFTNFRVRCSRIF